MEESSLTKFLFSILIKIPTNQKHDISIFPNNSWIWLPQMSISHRFGAGSITSRGFWHIKNWTSNKIDYIMYIYSKFEVVDMIYPLTWIVIRSVLLPAVVRLNVSEFDEKKTSTDLFGMVQFSAILKLCIRRWPQAEILHSYLHCRQQYYII